MAKPEKRRSSMPNHEPRDMERSRRRADFGRAGMRLDDLLSNVFRGGNTDHGFGG